MTHAQRAAAAALVALVAVQWLWHGATLAAGVYSLPLLLLGLLLASRRSHGWFWVGVLALPYFVHGTVEAFASPAHRAPALAETVLAGSLVLLVSWDGMRARFGGSRGGKRGGGANV